MNKLAYILVGFCLVSCQSKKLEWSFDKKIALSENVRPLGITEGISGLWISDPDNNRVINIDENGETQKEIGGLNRPMHIDIDNERLRIPNFSTDSISVYYQSSIGVLSINDSLDAPSGISSLNEIHAIADFYNHRVLLIKDGKTIQIGKEGRTDGLLYYPTDVKLYEDKVIVADAYNNRVQMFDQEGNFLKVIGWQEEIKVATGVDVYDDQIFVTDFYGNRLLIYDFEGNLLNSFEGNFNKPTDVLVSGNKLFATNYGENTVSVFHFE